VAIVILTILLNLAVRLFERRVMPWQTEQQTREISI
jgi:ABC-type nitrate/sulfonate/bicarbonate transport system permease component